MASQVSLNPENLADLGIEVLRRRWGWILGLGVALLIAGTAALSSSLLMTVFSMTLLGWVMCTSGILQAVHAFTCKGWSGFFIDLLAGVLYVVVGFMVIANPAATAVALTLLIAVFLIFGGIFRVVVSLVVRYPNWIWMFLHGVVILLLGISIWKQWPLSGLWVIGLFVGIDLIFNGLSLVMLGLAAKKLPLATTASE
jgi:uncharacterized membrane protein HdeD (DUF308 family)